MKNKIIISPSVFSLNFLKLRDQLKILKNLNIKWLHFDVMDGNFVKNISFGPKILKIIKKETKLFIDVHMMVKKPLFLIDLFIKNGANLITVHIEIFNNIKEGIFILKLIKKKKIKVGIAIKPKTDFKKLIPYLKFVDVVLLMSVEPGFSGQKFILNSFNRIKKLFELRKLFKHNFLISVDGGINKNNFLKIKKNGANILIVGSYIFSKYKNIKKSILTLLKK